MEREVGVGCGYFSILGLVFKFDFLGSKELASVEEWVWCGFGRNKGRFFR